MVEFGIVISLYPAVNFTQLLEALYVSGLVEGLVCESDGERARWEVCRQVSGLLLIVFDAMYLGNSTHQYIQHTD